MGTTEKYLNPVTGHRRYANLVTLNLGHTETDVQGKNGIPAPAPSIAVEEHLSEEEGTGKNGHLFTARLLNVF